MTEKEYVEHIRSRAKAYIAELAPGIEISAWTIADWGNTKGALSPHTMVKLCETWLERESATESAEKPRDGDNPTETENPTSTA
jgi:hypothetical protein